MNNKNKDICTSLAAEPSAPTPAIPLDLGALLSPEGAYEPGTGQEDGAQLVDLCWWAPMHGCETLENLLDRIRLRILPHLRPAPASADHVPDAGNMVPAADDEREELAQWLDHKGRGAWPCPDGFSAEAEAEEYEMFSGLTRAAALLRQPAPAPMPVPVAERPWERPGWCDAEGRCWWFNRVGIPEWQLADGGPYGEFCLPHWAIAIPQPPQGGEVA